MNLKKHQSPLTELRAVLGTDEDKQNKVSAVVDGAIHSWVTRQKALYATYEGHAIDGRYRQQKSGN